MCVFNLCCQGLCQRVEIRAREWASGGKSQMQGPGHNRPHKVSLEGSLQLKRKEMKDGFQRAHHHSSSAVLSQGSGLLGSCVARDWQREHQSWALAWRRLKNGNHHHCWTSHHCCHCCPGHKTYSSPRSYADVSPPAIATCP